MRLHYRVRPQLEALENRWAPAIAIATPVNACNPGGFDLLITSTPGVAVTTGVLVESTGVDTYDVTEFTSNLGVISHGSFTVTDNITIDLTTFPGSLSAAGVSVGLEMDFAGEDLEGDVVINLPNATSGSFAGVGSFGGGAIVGNGLCSTGAVTMNTGTGSDATTVGFSPFSGPGPVDVNGNVTISTGAGSDITDFWGGVIGGDVTITNSNLVRIGMGGFGGVPVTLQGDLAHRNTSDSTNVAGFFQIDNGSVIQGNASIITNVRPDTVFLGSAGTGPGTIRGNATISMGAGVNSFTMFGADAGAVFGNLTLSGGNQRDVINLQLGSLVLGNATFNLGSSGTTSPNANVLNLDGIIAGTSIVVRGGGGRDEVRFTGAAIGACLDATLGSGNDRFELGSNVLARASIDGGFGTDVFVSTVVISFPFTVKRFP